MTTHNDAWKEVLDEEERVATAEDIKNIIKVLQENPPTDGHELAILLRKHAVPCDERVLAARQIMYMQTPPIS